MSSRTSTAVVAVALAFGVPAVARAAGAPTMPGQPVGRSELPRAVDDTLTRESGKAGDEIGRLRLQTRGGHDEYSADLVGNRGEILTVDSKGRVLSRQSY